MTRLVLASQSPRRQALLRLLTEDFEVLISDADETLPEGIAPADAVMMLAARKAEAVAALCPDALVIGADTVVAIDGQILGKPADAKEAGAMLRLLSGRVHEVYTGVCLWKNQTARSFCCVTQVDFAPLSEQEITWYVASGEPFDKAGGYGIQGLAARFVRGITGDYFNVMGLPVRMLYEHLGDFTK